MIQRTRGAISPARTAHKFTFIMITRLLAAGNVLALYAGERIATFLCA